MVTTGRSGTARITLGAVVLDRPDLSGRYIAKDMAGGWAYIVADREGDTRARGNGGCAGGLDVQLRCSFLLAVSQASDSARLMIVVESRKAHRTMVDLAQKDGQVMDAIDSRPVSIMTRPDERASFQAKAAAERAAASVLDERARAEWLALEDGRAAIRDGGPADGPATPAETPHPAPQAAPGPAASTTAPGQGWRSRTTAGTEAQPTTMPPQPDNPPRNPALTEWLRDFDRRISSPRPPDDAHG